MPPIPFTSLFNTVQLLAENILESGSGRRQPLVVFSEAKTHEPAKAVSLNCELTLNRALVNAGEHSLRVYSTGDGPDVYEDKFMAIAKPDGSQFQPTLVLVGTRLGIDKITPVYWEALIAALQMPQSVGIAG